MKLMSLNVAIVSLVLAGCSATSAMTNSGKQVAGYLYTSLNGETTNQVVSFERYEDGTLGRQRTYSTGSLGGANRSAGGDAAGDFDCQGAVQIIGEYLLVVNAGGNTVTVFDLDKDNGALTIKKNVDSGGTRPVSIAFTKKSSGANEYWVVVGNQWNNPNVQKGGAGEGPIEMYPNAAFHAPGGGHEQRLKERNIFLFSFNSSTGELSPERAIDTYVGTHGGPTTVEFNSDGTRLGVATWGIAHFATATPTHQKPSRVYVYDFDKTQGQATNTRYFQEDGIAGSIGFSWDKKAPQLYVSNFNLIREKRDHSLTVLRDDGHSTIKVANFGTGDGNDIDEACWTTLDPSGENLYVSSFGGNLISTFHVDARGQVDPIGRNAETAYVRRKDGTPAGDTKDMYVTLDGKFLYNLGAYQTFTVSRFDIAENGTLTLAREYRVDSATEKGAGAYNFLGLTGFDR